jgi:hypothetical protein
MKKQIVVFGAAVALAMAVGSTKLVAAAVSGCDLPNDKWSCEVVEETTSTIDYVRNGKSHMCKVFETTLTVRYYEAYNPAGNRNAAHDGEPEILESGESVHIGNAPCP